VAGRVLEFGTEPADDPPRLLGGTLGIEGHQLFEDLLIGQRARPTVRLEHRRVEVVVDLLEDGNQALLVDDLVFLRQRFARAKKLSVLTCSEAGALGLPERPAKPNLSAATQGLILYSPGRRPTPQPMYLSCIIPLRSYVALTRNSSLMCGLGPTTFLFRSSAHSN